MGIHYMDACRWGLGLQTLPNRVVAAGGRLRYVDDGETPNTLITLLDYEETPVIFEVRGLPKNATYRDATWSRNMDQYMGIGIGTILFCEGGTIRLNTNGSCAAYDNSGEKIRDFTQQRESAKENFINAVRAEDPSMLYTDATEGHLSCGLVHMTNIAYRIGATTSPSVIRERMQEEKPLGEATERMLEHIRANNVDLTETPLRVGPVLKLDPKHERFVGPMSDAANALVSREYRNPFVVPNEV